MKLVMSGRTSIGGGPIYRVLDDDGALLGEVRRLRVSTDTKIAGTRQRRQGVGRDEWQAFVLVDDSKLSGEWWQLHGNPMNASASGRGYGEVRPPYRDGEVDPASTSIRLRREAVELIAGWHENGGRHA